MLGVEERTFANFAFPVIYLELYIEDVKQAYPLPWSPDPRAPIENRVY